MNSEQWKKLASPASKTSPSLESKSKLKKGNNKKYVQEKNFTK